MLQCAGSLLLLELLAPDSSLSIMLIRVRLTAVKESPPLGFPSHPATPQFLRRSHLYSPCTSPDIPFPTMKLKVRLYTGLKQRQLTTLIPHFNNPPSGLEMRLHVQLLQGTKKEAGKHLGIRHMKEDNTIQGWDASHNFGVSDNKIDYRRHCSYS